MTIVLCVLAGAALGIRYQVFSLIPITVVFTTAVVIIHHTDGESIVSSVLAAPAAIVELQIGYFLGAVARPAVTGLMANFSIRRLRLHDR